jgi:hypothetical protein
MDIYFREASSQLFEKWSDAARKAAAAGRKARGSGKSDASYDARMGAARTAFRKAGGKAKKLDVDAARRAITATRRHDSDAGLPKNEYKWMRRSLYKKARRKASKPGYDRERLGPRSTD